MNNIEIKNISVTINPANGISKNIIKDISFSIEKNKITSILAPEGSGISTLLKSITGVTKPDSGEINSDGNLIYLPEEPSSYPWMNVADNIKFAAPKISDSDLEQLVNVVGLEGYEAHIPDNKSYGFRFRISLARAIAANPSAIVIDNSFGIMDSEAKEECYSLIKKINQKLNTTFLIGTSNISEALFLSNKILLMSKNPAAIVETITEKLPFENDLKEFESTKFIELRTTIEKSLKEIHNQRMSNFII